MSYKSRLLTFSSSVTTTGTLDGEINLNTAIDINPNKPHTLKVVRAAITSNIPNVYNYGTRNYGYIVVSNDAGLTPVAIQLSDGVYSVDAIQQAIIDVTAAWWTSTSDPGIVIRANTVTGYCYIILDSSKLSGGGVDLLTIDFKATDGSGNVSKMCELLGYSATTDFSADGTYSGDVYPQLDLWGNKVHIKISGFGPLGIYNQLSSEIACTIPLTTDSVLNEYTFPGESGQAPWEVPIRVPGDKLVNYKVTFIGDRDLTLPLLAYDGKADISFLITQY